MKPLFPLVALGLTAACGMALAHDAAHDAANAGAPQAPARCELRLTPVSGGTEIEGRVIALVPVSGTYDLALTSRTGGNSMVIRQSGDFAARPGEDAILTETRLSGAPSRHDVDLDVTVAGRPLACTRNL